MKKFLLLLPLLLLSGFQVFGQLANWSNIGVTNFPLDISPQINGFSRIVQLKFHSTDPNKFYAVTSEGGLFISTDAGSNWAVAPGTETTTSSCASICVDRTNDQVMYLGTGDPNYYSTGAGVFKSTDGGVTFATTPLTNCLVIDIIQHPTDPNTFVAVTNKGIYKSTNNGTTWPAVTATNITFCDMQQNTAANSLILYACTNENTPRFYRSTDFGSTWTQITSGIVAATTNIQSGSRIAVTPADPNVVYFSEVGGGGMIFKSTDGGLNFTQKKGEGAPYLTFYDNSSGSSGQGNYNSTLCADRVDPSKLWFQSQNTWYSSDNGVNWTMLCKWSTILHTDHHHLLQNPYDATKMYSCNDGGVWLSTDGGASWTPKSNGLYAYEIPGNAAKSSHTDPFLVSIGTQDNGRLYRNGTSWYTTIGGDDYDRREFDYLPSGGYFYNLDDNTRTKAPNGSTGTYGIPTTTVQAMGFNRSNTELAFMGNQDIYRTTNLSAGTPGWTQISTFNKTIMAVHSCIADPSRLYVITSDQLIYVSTNATAASPTFTSYSLPAASNTRASIAAICTNADIVYIAINNKVYRSSNGGQNWTDITTGLPNVTHRRILSEDYGGTQELVFVATNNAVYYRKASPGTWTNYSSNLPARRSPTDFSMFDDGTNRARIRYASYGRAVWETAFGNLRASQSIFTADHTNDLCLTNGVVKFTDLSLGGPSAWAWSFPGGTPASSTDQNPTVTYTTPGTYSVTLTITTGSGPFTTTQSNYITVPAISAGGTYNVGTGGDFATLTAAVNYWNNNCINGPVVFNLTDANYPSETFPITINAAGPQSSLKIKPTGTTTITGSASTALIIINGADRVTIDGSSGNTANTVCPLSAASRDLTLTNNNTGTSSAVIWLQSNGSDGATDNTVKNCKLVGQANTTTLFGVGSGSSAIGTSSFGTDNDNNSFVNNSVQKTQYGIYSGGASVINKNTGNIINQNVINAASPNNILRTGILVKFEDNILISGNAIGNTNVQNNTASHGIACGGEASGSYTSFSGSEVTGATITYNVIDNIVRGQTAGTATGIFLASVNSTTGSGPTLIANNMITRVNAPSANAGQYACGITIGGGRNSNTKVYYNSINLTGTQSNNIQSFGVMVGGSENTAIVDLKDNIIVNQSSSTNRNYVIGLAYSSPYPRLFSNYNDLYTSGSPFAVVGGLGNSPAGDLSDFNAWKTSTGKDANSKNVLPEFISATNLHLNTSGANNLANLIGFGTPLSVTTDIDCETRYSNPDIGTDENCISPTIPTLSASVNPICPGASTTLSITAGNLNKALLWQWYSGSCGGSTAGTGTSITVSPTVTTTYYVRGEGGCVTPGSCASITVVVNNPAPVIIGPTSVCSGGSVTLDAGAGYTAYAWSNGGGSGQTAMFSNIISTTTYTVTVTNAAGCTGTDTHIVTVNPNPAPTITGPNSVCSGGSVTLNAGAGYTSYAWSNSGGSSQMATFSNITATTTYTVTVTNASGCSGTDTKIVSVNPNPVPTITGPTSVCSGGNATLDAGAGYTTYAWSNGGGNGQTPTFSNITSTTTYTVTVTDGNGCSGTDTHTVNVNPNPAPAITGPISVCSGGSATLDAGTGYATYAWSNSGGNSQTATFSNLTSTTTYTVTVTNASGCSGTDTHTVTVNPNPAPAISGPTSVCDGGSATLDAGAGYATYAWSNSGGSSQTATFSNITSPTTYTVTVTNASGCSGTATQSITVNPNPTPTITGLTSLCSGGNATLDAGAGYTSYAWSNSGGSSQTATFSNITSTTTYTVTVTTASGCSGTDTHIVTVNPNPAPAITGPSSVCSGGSATLDAGAGYTTYAWSNSGGSSQTATFSNITSTTTYTVTVTNASGCSGTDTHTVTVNPNPTPTITGPASVCSGSNLTLDAGAGYTSYAWSNSGGSSQTAVFSNVTSATTYAVTVSTAFGCTGTDTHFVDVNPSPVPAVTGVASVCSGGNATLDAGAGYTTYAWSNSGGSGQTATFSNITSTTTYTVTVTGANGCSGTDTHSITVNPNPTPAITGPATVCSGNSATLDAGAGYSSYAWSNSGGNGQTATFLNITSTTTYSVTVTNASGCSGADTHVVTASGYPAPSITGPTTVCSGGSATLNAGSGYATYAWSDGGGSGQTATFSNITSAMSYTVTVTNAAGCSGTASHSITVLSCFSISGKSYWEADDVSGVKDVVVTLSGDANDVNTTDVSGNYTLMAPSGNNFVVTPKKNKPMPDAINGMSAADASRIQQHVTGAFPLTDPYKLIAADVNKNNAVTSFDASQITQAILGNPVVQLYFSNNTWRFVPAAYVFPVPTSPWGFPETISLTGAASDQDFIGCKLGDVNNTANPANSPNAAPPELVWTVQNQALTANAEMTVEFKATGFDALLGLQFALKFDPAKLQLLDLQTVAGGPMLTANFGTYNLAAGEIRAALPLSEILSLPDGTPVFRLRFKVLQNGGALGEALHLDNTVLTGEAYLGDYTTGPVNLLFEDLASGTTEQSSGRLVLLQNKPNPFRDQVSIGFILPGSCETQLRVIDPSGRLVAEYKGWSDKGYNERQFDLSGYAGQGLLYYELTTPFGTLAKKMVLVRL